MKEKGAMSKCKGFNGKGRRWNNKDRMKAIRKQVNLKGN